jgi:hypothetical protein
MTTFKFQKRRGIGNVITTLIILIASVVLGAGVVFFGGSMFQSSSQEKSIQVSNSHVWVSMTNTTTPYSQAAFVVQNTGSKAVAISSVTIRGMSIPTTSWYFDSNGADTSSLNTQTTLNPYTYGSPNPTGLAKMTGATVSMKLADGNPHTFNNAPGPVSLNPGQLAIVYIVVPVTGTGSIQQTDAGLSLTMNVGDGQTTAVQTVGVVGF